MVPVTQDIQRKQLKVMKVLKTIGRKSLKVRSFLLLLEDFPYSFLWVS